MQVSTQLLLRASLLLKNPLLKKDGLFDKICDIFPDKNVNEINIMMEHDFSEVVGFMKQGLDDDKDVGQHKNAQFPDLS